MTTLVRGRWFPATVLLPNRTTLRKVYVLAAEGGDEGGLWAWQGSPDRLAYRADVDWGATPAIPDARQARNGVSFRLADGDLVVVTPGAGCKCGQLGRWAGPAWSSTVGLRA